MLEMAVKNELKANSENQSECENRVIVRAKK